MSKSELKEEWNDEWMKQKEWEEFRSSGLLWWINTILHTFGWAITLEYNDGKVTSAYPSRVRYRGFSEKDMTNGYIKVSEYMKEQATDLLEESKS